MPGWSSEGPERVNFRERDSEYKDGLMSAHFQWVASPSEKAGLLLSALLIGLVNLGSRGLDTAARRTASVSGVVGSSQRSQALYDLYQRLPLTFERNAGQTDRRVKFLARGPGYSLFLTGDEAVLALRSRQSSVVSGQLQKTTDHGLRTTDVLRMKLVGVNQAAKVTALEELPGKSNYFVGNDPQKWRTGVPTYAKVKCEAVYPGVDVIYYGNQGQLEYDFVVAPGADPKMIALKIETGKSKIQNRKSKIRVDANGDLAVQAEGGEVRFHKPVVYQEEPGVRSQESGGQAATDDGPRTTDAANPKSKIQDRKLLDGRYVLTAGNRVSFEVTGYDRSKPLVIDPVLSYATYLGGTGGDVAYGIAVDSSGAAYVTGSTASRDFPVASAEQTAYAGGSDVFVTKFNPAGSAPVYSTYLGGSGPDVGSGIVVDSSGAAYVVGTTSSTNFGKSNGSRSSGKLPPSMRDTSSISLMSRVNWSAFSLTPRRVRFNRSSPRRATAR